MEDRIKKTKKHAKNEDNLASTNALDNFILMHLNKQKHFSDEDEENGDKVHKHKKGRDDFKKNIKSPKHVFEHNVKHNDTSKKKRKSREIDLLEITVSEEGTLTYDGTTHLSPHKDSSCPLANSVNNPLIKLEKIENSPTKKKKKHKHKSGNADQILNYLFGQPNNNSEQKSLHHTSSESLTSPDFNSNQLGVEKKKKKKSKHKDEPTSAQKRKYSETECNSEHKNSNSNNSHITEPLECVTVPRKKQKKKDKNKNADLEMQKYKNSDRESDIVQNISSDMLKIESHMLSPKTKKIRHNTEKIIDIKREYDCSDLEIEYSKEKNLTTTRNLDLVEPSNPKITNHHKNAGEITTDSDQPKKKKKHKKNKYKDSEINNQLDLIPVKQECKENIDNNSDVIESIQNSTINQVSEESVLSASPHKKKKKKKHHLENITLHPEFIKKECDEIMSTSLSTINQESESPRKKKSKKKDKDKNKPTDSLMSLMPASSQTNTGVLNLNIKEENHTDDDESILEFEINNSLNIVTRSGREEYELGISSDSDSGLEEDCEKAAELTENDYQMLGTLNILLPFIPPLIHTIESRLSAGLTKDQVATIKELKINFKRGNYTKAEDEQIIENWNEFYKSHDIPNNPRPFFCICQKSVIKIVNLETRIKFAQYLAKGLNDRLLSSVHRRFRTMFGDYKRGRFSPKEDSIIVTQRECNNDNLNTFTSIAKLLNRDRISVQKRYVDIKLKQGCDLKEKPHIQSEEFKLVYIRALMKVMEFTDYNQLKYAEISFTQWRKLGVELGVRPIHLQRLWTVTIHTQLFSAIRDSQQILKRLVDIMYEDETLQDFRNINYRRYQQYFDGVLSESFYKIFTSAVSRVPKSSRGSIRDCLAFMKRKPMTKKFPLRSIDVSKL